MRQLKAPNFHPWFPVSVPQMHRASNQSQKRKKHGGSATLIPAGFAPLEGLRPEWLRAHSGLDSYNKCNSFS